MSKLTEEEKFTLLAIHLGWEPAPTTGAWYTVSAPAGKPLLSGFRKETGVVEPIPDYFGSLDAVHEAEKVLTDPADFCRYCEQLCLAVSGGRTKAPTYASVAATATQRAEALGLTLGLWKEGE